MLDTVAINLRFFNCYPDKSRSDLKDYFSIHHSEITQWVHNKRQIPWGKLKHLADTRGIRWDWLLEGKGGRKRKGFIISDDAPAFVDGVFDTEGINRRVFELFAGFRQIEIAGELGVSQSAVSSWKTNRKQTPWEKLEQLVHSKGVTWEWLLEGR